LVNYGGEGESARRYGVRVLGRLAGKGSRMTSIERTAYPQFRRLTSARVLQR
jgi:hypothetical protein